MLSHKPTQGKVRRRKTDIPINRHFEIEYIDKDGSESKRHIYIHFVSHDKTYRENIYCYCYLKSDHRQFLIHKILSMRDLTTNEIVADKIEYLKSIRTEA